MYVMCFQDLHSSVWFMFIASSRAFALWLDTACLVYIGLVTFSFLFVDRGNSMQIISLSYSGSHLEAFVCL